MSQRTLLLLTLSLAGASVVPHPAAAQTPDEHLAAGSALYDAKRYDEAAKRLDAFLAAAPAHKRAAAAALVLARSRVELDQWDKAVAAYEKAVAAKDPAITPVAQLGLGEAALQVKQYDKAVTALDAALKIPLKPEQEAVALLWLGQANFELGRFTKAREAYDQVTQKHPRAEFVDEAWFGAGVAAFNDKQEAEARQRLSVVVDRYRSSPDRPRARLLLAQMDLRDKKNAEARRGFEAITNGGPEVTNEVRAAAEDGLIQVLLSTEDYAAAVPRLESALRRLPAGDPQRSRAHLSLGHARYRQKQYEPALTSYMEASRAAEEPVAGEGLYWAANAQLALNRADEAAKLFAALTTRFPRHELAAKARTRAADTSTDPAQLAAALKNLAPAERVQPALRLARIHLNAKKYAEADAVLSPLVMGPLDADAGAEARYLLGVSSEAQNRSAVATQWYAAAVKAKPEADWAAEVNSRLAWLYLDAKRAAEAERAASAALAPTASSTVKLTPDQERQTRLALVQALLDQEKWDAALEGTKTLQQGSPAPDTLAAVLFTQAWVADKRMKPDEARPLWEKLAAEHGKTPYAAQALVKLGDEAVKAEKWDEAKDRFSRLLADHPKHPAAVEARFKLGSALYNGGKPAEAVKEFDAVAAEKTAGPLVPESLYWAGVAFDKAGSKPEAIARLSQLVAKYPTHARVANAKVRLAALKAVNGG
jgi:TolA-binding protein